MMATRRQHISHMNFPYLELSQTYLGLRLRKVECKTRSVKFSLISNCHLSIKCVCSLIPFPERLPI